MKQKTRIASKLFAALVVLTLISCCFLGTTMARYTSAGTGKAAVQVAKWNIALNGTDTMDDETEITSAFNKLSPNMDAYNTADMDYSVENPRTNVIGDVDKGNAPMLVATLENRGDVDAKITVSWTAPECRDSNSSAIANFGEQGTALSVNDGFLALSGGPFAMSTHNKLLIFAIKLRFIIT